MSEQKMLSIWFFVGVMLTLLGAIILSTGVYYIFYPQQKTVLSNINPSLWWGAIMLAVGLAFLVPSIKAYRSSNSN
ncbi:MAG: hypothetical protein ONB31_01165 [candidate division KSB1 bacterium]|nr:hypothetical protein [candidate division KSB1 bacterium]MDZ7334139.1 hypothetical protein [candidate division KSB1 bacterium]MDZ7357387.1 hypothetical protein [candidate division KSB1 bacterium]MDZ7401365.1 hypothetical protein [candidate division KSB1 bacterium]